MALLGLDPGPDVGAVLREIARRGITDTEEARRLVLTEGRRLVGQSPGME